MKVCELCHRAANMYCEADRASLCWECDANVHGANFLVARHARALLCRSCQAPTPWRAAGPRLSPTISVCERCSALGKMASAWDRDELEEGEAEGSGGAGRMMVDEEDDVEDLDDDEEEEEVQDEEGESQVVPWKLTPPPAASSSSGEDFPSSDRGSAIFLKRIRENADLDSKPQRDFPLPSSHRSQLNTSRLIMPLPFPAPSATPVDDSPVSASFLPSKDRRRSISRSDARPT